MKTLYYLSKDIFYNVDDHIYVAKLKLEIDGERYELTLNSYSLKTLNAQIAGALRMFTFLQEFV